MRLSVLKYFWIAVLVFAAVPWAGAQDADAPTAVSAESPAAVDTRLQPAIDRLEAALAELEALEMEWREQERVERTAAESRLEEVAILEAELAAAENRSPKVDALYDRVNPLVVWAIEEVRAALERARRPSELPAWLQTEDSAAEAQPFGGAGGELSSSEATQHLEELRELLVFRGERLRDLELELRLADVQRDVDLASRIYKFRLATLSGLTFERRAAVYSWVRADRDAIRLESEVLELVARLQSFRLKSVLAVASVKLRGLFTALFAGRILVRLLVIVLLWRWVQRGRAEFLLRMRRKAEALEDPQRQRWATSIVEFGESVAPWGIFILAVASFGWAFKKEVVEIPFLYGTLMLVATYGTYRLAVDLVVGAAAAGMESAGVELTTELRRKLHVLVRWVMRAATLVVYVLWLYSYHLGGGVLYSKIRLIGVALVAVVLLTVVIRFRREVRQMYLAVRAQGKLADLVRDSDERWTNYLVTPITFIWLCGHGVYSLLRGLTFSFERTRSATAYLSRRRLLKVAEQRGFAEGDLEGLPVELVGALDEKLSIDDLETIGGFPGLDVARASAAKWRDGQAGGSALLAGEEGLGKRAWLEQFLALEGGGTHLQLSDRILSPVKLRGWLAEHLVPEGGSLSQDELIEAICAGPRRIVVLGAAEHLFLATVNGYKALAELGPIVDGTRKRVFWLLSMRGLAWNHLRAAGKELAFLRRKFVLEPKSEEQIEALIDHRMERAGFRVSFANLMAVEGREEDEIARNKLGRQTFMNLLCDFSGGNPQIALHFFLRSLQVTADGSLEVLPFQVPVEAHLNEASSESLFLLAAVMRHNGLSVRQAATTTNYAIGRVEGMFLHLLDEGTVSEDDDIYRVATSWRATVLRVLRRGNILVS